MGSWEKMRKFENGTLGKAMQIEAVYTKGGISWSGKVEKRGIYIHFSNVTVEQGCVKSMPQKDFKIFWKELPRISSKALSNANMFLSEHKDTLFELFKENNRNTLLDLIQDNRSSYEL